MDTISVFNGIKLSKVYGSVIESSKGLSQWGLADNSF